MAKEMDTLKIALRYIYLSDILRFIRGFDCHDLHFHRLNFHQIAFYLFILLSPFRFTVRSSDLAGRRCWIWRGIGPIRSGECVGTTHLVIRVDLANQRETTSNLAITR